METISHKLPEEKQICGCCGGKLHEIPGMKEMRRELEIVPAKVSVVIHEGTKYGCRHCERHEISAPIITVITATARSCAYCR